MSAITFMPYYPSLNIDKKYGDFHLWNWHKHKGDYLNDPASLPFLEKYFAIYKRVDGSVEQRITILEHATKATTLANGIPMEMRRLPSAAMFCHVKNLPVSEDEGFFASASDNFDAYHQLFDPAKNSVSVQLGSYVQMQLIAGKLENLTLVTPQHVPNQDYGIGDEKLLDRLARICDDPTPEVERLFRALDWIGFAFSNSHGHVYASRIVAMATAFEILLELPRNDKGQEFSTRMNARLLPNTLPQTTRVLGNKKPRPVGDNVVGWWCRDFYELRSKIVHGDFLQQSEFMNNGVEHLKIAVFLFAECVDDLLVNKGVLPEAERLWHFWFTQRNLIKALAINGDDFAG